MTLNPKVATEKLKLILGGPVSLEIESAESNQARNTLFEIHLAARAWQAELPTRLGPVSDVLSEFLGRHLFIECKRPLSAKKVRRRIRNAEEQLRQHLRVALPNSRGIIAVSLSKLLNPSAMIFAMTDRSQGQRMFEEKVQAMAEEYADTWRRLNKKIIGIIFSATASAFEPSSPLFFTVHHSLGYCLTDMHSPDNELFARFHEKLATSIPF